MTRTSRRLRFRIPDRIPTTSVLALAVLVLTAFAMPAFAQRELDEMKSKLATAEGSEKATLLLQLAEATQSTDMAESLRYCDNALSYSRDLNDQNAELSALITRGITLYLAGDYSEALATDEQALELALVLGNQEAAANAINNIGILHYMWGDYDEALDSYMRSLEIREELEDRSGMARTYNNLANIYYEMGRHEDGLEHYELALAIYEEDGEQRLVANTLNNIGLLHAAREDHALALDFYERAFAIEESLGDRAGMALTQCNIGMVLEAKGELDPALEQYRRSLATRRRIGDRQGLAICLHNIGTVHFLQGDHDDALQFLTEGLELASELGLKEMVRESHEALADLHEAMGNHELALASHRAFKAVNDEVFDRESTRRLQTLQTRYRVAQKDLEIEGLRREQEVERATRRAMRAGLGVLVLGIVILLLVLLLLYSRYRAKVRINREIRERNEALRRAHEELERAARTELSHVARVATMGELSAALAHELNQPLAAILSNAQAGGRFLERDERANPDVVDALDDIAGDAKRAREIILRMRELMRRGEIEQEPVDVADALRRVEAIARADAEHMGLDLEMDLAEGLPPVLGDRIQLQQVVLNLLHNGAESMFRHPDGRKRLVLRSSRTDDGAVRVAVRDAGPPVEDGVVDRMFEPFYSTKREGLGMGLPICRTIIEAHGGQLWATRNDGDGLTVQFTLPAAS